MYYWLLFKAAGYFHTIKPTPELIDRTMNEL